MGIKHDASYRSGENMAKKTDEELYDVAINHKVIFDYLFKSSYMPV